MTNSSQIRPSLNRAPLSVAPPSHTIRWTPSSQRSWPSSGASAIGAPADDADPRITWISRSALGSDADASVNTTSALGDAHTSPAGGGDRGELAFDAVQQLPVGVAEGAHALAL